MTSNVIKPKLVYFQASYRTGLPEFLLLHAREHVRCLEESFVVEVVNYDCDFQEICDRFEPDLVLFETGVNLFTKSCVRPRIQNLRGQEQVARAALINADAWCETRAGTIFEIEQWGVQAAFAISTTAAEHLPNVVENLFVWPNFIDPSVFQDYGEEKRIPILLTGARALQYPWRQVVYKILAERYPTLSCPHQGYLSKSLPLQVMFGEKYARTINSSICVPTCGTVAKEVVRKHFEIPASRSCLVTERSPGLLAAGFIDMENCVFADESNITDKLDYLFGNPDILKRITDAGHSLVHDKHTLRHRTQILEWYNLRKEAEPDERIVQPSPFGILQKVKAGVPVLNQVSRANGLHLQCLEKGDRVLWEGSPEVAERHYLRSLNYMRRLPEAFFRLALCKLYLGSPKEAAKILTNCIRYTLFDYRAESPDPVEWAYYLVALVCDGKMAAAARSAKRFPLLRHKELDYCVWMINSISNVRIAGFQPQKGQASFRPSVHQLPERDMKEWIAEISKILISCGRHNLAKKLQERPLPDWDKGNNRPPRDGFPSFMGNHRALASSSKTHQRANSATHTVKVDRLLVELWYLRFKRKLTSAAVTLLGRLENRFGCFLPYSISTCRRRPFLRVLESIGYQARSLTVLVIGGSTLTTSLVALATGPSGVGNHQVFLVDETGKEAVIRSDWASRQWGGGRPAIAGHTGLTLQVERVLAAINRIKQTNQIASFDVVMIGCSALKVSSKDIRTLWKSVEGWSYMVLQHTDRWLNSTYLRTLDECSDCSLVWEKSDEQNGSAVFWRTTKWS